MKIYTVEGLGGYLLGSQLTESVTSLGLKPERHSWSEKKIEFKAGSIVCLHSWAGHHIQSAIDQKVRAIFILDGRVKPWLNKPWTSKPSFQFRKHKITGEIFWIPIYNFYQTGNMRGYPHDIAHINLEISGLGLFAHMKITRCIEFHNLLRAETMK